MARCLAILSVVVCAIVFYSPSPAEIAAPEVPKEIAVPPGHNRFLQLEARGVQIYKATKKEEKTGKLEWVLEAPLADLSDASGGKAGYHYDSNGVSWEAPDGSKVVAQGKKPAPAPNAEKDIPWLLVKVKAEEGKTGKLTPAVYIQRVRTAGGQAPGEEPKRADTMVGVAYQAVYYFYEKAR